MDKTIILRFRDLITEDDGTISDHQTLISNFGEVWWGWWMKQNETPPKKLFKEIGDHISENKSMSGFLYNTGLNKLYETQIVRLLVGPSMYKIPTPDPEKSPSYYHRGSYPAWFLLNDIKLADFDKLKLTLVDLPTRSNDQISEYSSQIGKRINSLYDLQRMNVTLWVVRSE